MAHPSLWLFSVLFLFLMTTGGLSSRPRMAANVPENDNSFPNRDSWMRVTPYRPRQGLGNQQTDRDEMPPGSPGSREAGGPSLGGTESRGLDRPANLRQKGTFVGFALPYPKQENHNNPVPERAKKQGRAHRRHTRRKRLKQHRGKGAKLRPRALVKKPDGLTEHFRPFQGEGPAAGSAPTSFPSPMAQTLMEDLLPVRAISSQPQLHEWQEGDVMPTLDMALFDWTDYEDLHLDLWTSDLKKGQCMELCLAGDGACASACSAPSSHASQLHHALGQLSLQPLPSSEQNFFSGFQTPELGFQFFQQRPL